ncbi:MAG TPA: hypothetical protein VGO67_11100 [Verrucomicrobiae bacterium]|jgi:hypothetical protein
MQIILRSILSALLFGMALAARAGDVTVEARLVWGTSDDKTDAKCKPMDSDLSGKLHGMFRWKNYYEITNKSTVLELNKVRTIKMSDQCTLELKNAGGSRIEVNVIGNGKPVHKGAYTLDPPKWLVLGGNCDNSTAYNTAWFIGLRAVDKKALGKN